jgi:predicted DNA-binding transcriptional regulator AlpA
VSVPDPIQVMGAGIAAAVAEALAVHLAEMPLPKVGRAVYSEAALAVELGVSKRTLWEWASSGRGPRYVRAGKVRVYPVREVLDWLERSPAFASTAAEAEAKRRRRAA